MRHTKMKTKDLQEALQDSNLVLDQYYLTNLQITAFANHFNLTRDQVYDAMVFNAKENAKKLPWYQKVKFMIIDVYWLSYFGWLHDEKKHDLVTMIANRKSTTFV